MLFGVTAEAESVRGAGSAVGDHEGGKRVAAVDAGELRPLYFGPFGPDSDLRRWGLKLAEQSRARGSKQRAVMAVARKLVVLLHRLWLSGEVYDPLRQSRNTGVV